VDDNGGVGFVHKVKARLVHPGPQDLQETLTVAQLVKAFRAPAGIVFQIAVEAVHSVGPQEIRPAGPDRAALGNQARAQPRPAVADPEQLRPA
jgi:hypothetical protein